MDDREKLKHLLEHWIEHNRDHGEEFRLWASKAKDLGEMAAHDNLIKAISQIEKANEFLGRALEQID